MNTLLIQPKNVKICSGCGPRDIDDFHSRSHLYCKKCTLKIKYENYLKNNNFQKYEELKEKESAPKRKKQQNTDVKYNIDRNYVIKDEEIKKRCTQCKKNKNIEEFHLTSARHGNTVYKYRHSKCKECRNENKRKKILENKKKNYEKIFNNW